MLHHVKLVIIRHGKSTWNALGKMQGEADPPLHADGIQEAKKLLSDLGEELLRFTAIFSSEQIRARMVAEILSKGTDITVYYDSDLNSRRLGAFSGKTLDEIRLEFPEMVDPYLSGEMDFAPPGGESTKDVLNRCYRILQKLKNTYTHHDKLMIITHRGEIGQLHYLLTGEKMDDPIRKIKNCVPYYYEFTKIWN